jgi:hypothetical protein
MHYQLWKAVLALRSPNNPLSTKIAVALSAVIGMFKIHPIDEKEALFYEISRRIDELKAQVKRLRMKSGYAESFPSFFFSSFVFSAFFVRSSFLCVFFFVLSFFASALLRVCVCMFSCSIPRCFYSLSHVMFFLPLPSAHSVETNDQQLECIRELVQLQMALRYGCSTHMHTYTHSLFSLSSLSLSSLFSLSLSLSLSLCTPFTFLPSLCVTYAGVMFTYVLRRRSTHCSATVQEIIEHKEKDNHFQKRQEVQKHVLKLVDQGLDVNDVKQVHEFLELTKTQLTSIDQHLTKVSELMPSLNDDTLNIFVVYLQQM